MLSKEELKSMKAEEAQTKLGQLRTELFKMKIDKKTSGIAKPHLLKELRKDVARILTYQGQKNVRPRQAK